MIFAVQVKWIANLFLMVMLFTQASFAVGSLVWVEDPEVAWIDGEVVEAEADELKINCTSGKLVSMQWH